eukprot:4009557-Pyramimonas_sp.AAC.1
METQSVLGRGALPLQSLHSFRSEEWCARGGGGGICAASAQRARRREGYARSRAGRQRITWER